MRLVLLFAGIFFLAACGKNPRIYEESIKISDQEWSYEDSLDFTFEVKDTTQLYGLGLEVVFTEDYPYENIYTQIKTIMPDKSVKENLFSVELRNSEKRRTLICNEESCTIDVFLQAPLKFIELGDYTLRISQFTRKAVVPGILEISLYLEKLDSAYKSKAE